MRGSLVTYNQNIVVGAISDDCEQSFRGGSEVIAGDCEQSFGPGCGARLRARSLWHAAKLPHRPVVCCWIAMLSESTRIVYGMHVYDLCFGVD